MGATVIDGNALAEELSEHVHRELEQLKISGSVPGLATILVGDDPAAAAPATTSRAARPAGAATATTTPAR